VGQRKPIVGGNWKMNTNLGSATDLTRNLIELIQEAGEVDVVLFPPFPYLSEVFRILEGTGIMLGAQDMYPQPDGAFTGEVSLDMLRDCGCSWILAGHSERRHVIGETDVLVNQKVRAALDAGFNVILCVGETLDQREANQTDAINTGQLSYGLAGVTAEQMANVVIAYEPVWAIGTGKTATDADAQAAHASIRRSLADWYGPEVAEQTRIQYGGSMKPTNAPGLMVQNDIDGGLIGGAALKADMFHGIIQAAQQAGVPA